MPLALAVAVVALARRARLRELLPLAIAMLGSAVELLARIPFERYISAPTDRYIHPDGVAVAAEFYATQFARHGSAGHVGELLAFGTNIALGTQTVRYLQPMYFGQVLAVVVAIGWAPTSVRLRAAAAQIAPSRRRVFATIGAAPAGLLALGDVAVVVNLVVAPRTPPASIGCLEHWIDDRDLTGVGSFWNVRPAQVYGDDSVATMPTTGGTRRSAARESARRLDS